MRKILKILAWLLAVIIVLVVAAGIVLALTLDPNEYKTEITQEVKKATGRDLKIGGDIGLTYFPWLGVKLEKLELSNARGFGGKPFAKIESAGVTVRVIPLLTGNIKVGGVTLMGLNLNLAVNSQGRSNWDDLAGVGDKSDNSSRPAGKMPSIVIGSLKIKRANIHYDDRQSGSRYAVENLNLKTGRVEIGKPVDLKLSFVAKGTDLPVDAEIDLSTTLDLNLERQTVKLSNIRFQFADLVVTGTVNGSKILDNPAFSGKISIARFNLGNLLKAIDNPIATTDSKALTQVGLSTEFSLIGNQLNLKGLDMALDDSKVKGGITINLDSQAINFNLAIDNINADRYLPPASSGGASTASTGNEELIPVKDLRALNGIRGKLTFGRLQALGFKTSKVKTTLIVANNKITLGPSRAQLYNGSYQGRILLDISGKTPKLTINEKVSGIDIKPFLTDAGFPAGFSGRANITITATARGKTINQITSTLNGNARFSVNDGTIEGLDTQKVDEQIKAIERKYKEDKKSGLISALKKAKKALPKIKTAKTDKTSFKQLQASAKIINGVINNTDLTIEGPHVHIRGKGQIDLGRNQFRRYVLTVSTYPLIIDGPFDNLSFKPDWKTIWKEKRSKRKAKRKAKVEAKKTERKKKFKDWKERLKKKWKK